MPRVVSSTASLALGESIVTTSARGLDAAAARIVGPRRVAVIDPLVGGGDETGVRIDRDERDFMDVQAVADQRANPPVADDNDAARRPRPRPRMAALRRLLTFDRSRRVFALRRFDHGVWGIPLNGRA